MHLLLVATCCLSHAIAPPASTPADLTQPPGKGIDAATVAQYEKLGAVYGGSKLESYWFHEGYGLPDGALPGFRFWSFPNAKLPPVAVPFMLSLHGAKDEQLKQLADLKNLTSLYLSGTNAHWFEYGHWPDGHDFKSWDPNAKLLPVGLSEFRRGNTARSARNAAQPQFIPSAITDAGLEHLAPLTNLAALFLDFSGTTDEGLKRLSPLKKLQVLDLAKTQISDAGLKELANLPGLTTLHLSSTGVTDAGVDNLLALKNLKTLNLWNTGLTDGGLRTLAANDRLEALYLGRTKVSDAGLKELKRVPNLVALSFYDTKVTETGLKELASLKRLAWLDLSLTSADLDTLRELGLLHTISQAVGKAGKRAGSADEVMFVNISRTQVTDPGLKVLTAFKNLEVLRMQYCNVTDEGLKHLTSFKNLRNIDLFATKTTDAGVAELRKALPKCTIDR